ncbi:MAG TPA: hypothetical protein VGO09_05940 [Flavisolibacter sp.]|jgi:hypothetical protein|nr:hypothetical protein [Flavisolibacter sp.]
MKRLFFLFVIFFSLLSFTGFAKDSNISNRAIESFNSSFKGATEVSWTVINDYYKASFNLHGQYVAAFYDQDGILVAVSKNISSTQLPITLQAQIKSNYENFWISDLFEVNNEQGTIYYATIESAQSKIVLKSISNFEWETYKARSKF